MKKGGHEFASKQEGIYRSVCGEEREGKLYNYNLKSKRNTQFVS